MTQPVTEYIYRLKGGEEIAVECQNPILDRREPVVIYCEDGSTKMKIGDGIHKYSELPYLATDTKLPPIDQTYTPESENAQSGKAVKEAIQSAMGDIETALDTIITMQENLIGGDEE